MLIRYRRLIARTAIAAMAVAVFVAGTAFASNAQTIYYYDINNAPAAPAMSSTCTTTYYVDTDGTLSSYVSCTPSYTIYYVPGYQYYLVSP